MPKIEYSVKKGDYLFSIAQKNGVTVKEIKSWNNLKSDFLKIGQKLSIYNRKFELLDGDSITFSSIPDKTLNIVSISGSVNRPGDYPLDQFSSLKDLIIFGANNILPNTYLGKVDISKENLDGSRSFNSYNLYDVLNDSVEVVLDDQDKVLIYSLEQVQGLDSISLISFVNDTLISIPWRENLSLYDFVFSNTPFENQDFQKQLLRSRVDINRFDRTSQNFYKISLDLDGDKEFILNKSDEIILYSKNISKNIFPTFKIDGYVNNPGIYRVDSLMTIEDAILKAGGLAEFADVSRVAINSLDQNSQNRSTIAKYVSLDMNYLLGKKNIPINLNLIKDFDRISIVKDPNIKQEFTVTIIGEVNSPGSVTLEFVNESVNDVIEKVGGLTANASLGASYIIRDSINIDFNFLRDLKKNISFLRDNDQIVIGNKKDEITVNGSVPNEVKLLYTSNRSKYYLKNAGGKVKKNSGKAYVIYPSGKSKKISFMRNPKIYPGSDVYVTFKNNQDKQNGRFLDRFTEVFSILTATLTTVILAKQLSTN